MAVEDFTNLILDKPPEYEYKTADDFKRHTIDETVESRPLDRAWNLLIHGEEVQKLSVLQSLPTLLKEDQEQCLQKILTQIKMGLPHASTEYNAVASEAFVSVLCTSATTVEVFVESLLPLAISSIANDNVYIVESWMTMLLETIDFMPKDVIKSSILPVAIKTYREVRASVMACELLSKISTKIDLSAVKRLILPVMIDFCKDVRAEIRAAVCQHISLFITVLDDASKSKLLYHILLLLKDDECIVRGCSIQAISEVLSFTSQEDLKNSVLPSVVEICKETILSEDKVMLTIAQNIAKLCLGLESLMDSSEKQWFIDLFKNLAKYGRNAPSVQPSTAEFGKIYIGLMFSFEWPAECRRYCAENFPGILQFIGPEEFQSQLYFTFCEFVCDSYYLVRQGIAKSINGIVNILGPNCYLVKKEVLRLLEDEVEEVIECLIPNIGSTLKLLTQYGDSRTTPKFLEEHTIEILLKCENKISQSYNWRLYINLLKEWECLPTCTSPEYLYNNFTSVLCNRLLTVRPLPCRNAVVDTLIVFLRDFKREGHKNSLRQILMSELANSDKHQYRMLYLYLCECVMKTLPIEYFKKHFLTPALKLSTDNVPNIRLKLVILLPKLRACLSIPEDTKLLENMTKLLDNLKSTEKDSDVLFALKICISEFEKPLIDDDEKPKQVKGKVIKKGHITLKGPKKPFVVSKQPLSMKSHEKTSKEKSPKATSKKSTKVSSYSSKMSPKRSAESKRI